MSLPTASCVDAFFAWQASCSQQQLRCSGCLDSTSTVHVASMVACLSMRKKKGVGERKFMQMKVLPSQHWLILKTGRYSWATCSRKPAECHVPLHARAIRDVQAFLSDHSLPIWANGQGIHYAPNASPGLCLATPKMHLLFPWVTFCNFMARRMGSYAPSSQIITGLEKRAGQQKISSAPNHYPEQSNGKEEIWKSVKAQVEEW